MTSTDVAVIIGGALVGWIALATFIWVRRARPRTKKRAHKNVSGGSWGTGRVQDRRALWARRYGAGAAWTAGAVGLGGVAANDGVGDPLARCGGSPGVIGDNCGGGGGCGGGCGGGN